MKKVLGSVSAVALGMSCMAEETKTTNENVSKLDELTVVASGSAQPIKEAPYTVYRITDEDLQLRLQDKSFIDALDRVPGVMLQKTGHGMTSPYLRGYTASRTVLMVDGVKLNNSILREGPNQYWNTVDPYFFDNIDVMMGPASVLYGSDAIGGTVYVTSSLDRGQKDMGTQWLGGEGFYRFSSAEDSHSVHTKGTIAVGDKFSLKLGATGQDFGDLKTGDKYDNEYTDYRQWGLNLRGQYWFDNDHSFYFGADTFEQDDVDRVHKTTAAEPWHGIAPGSDKRRTYDHQRDAVFARYQVRNGKGFIHEMDLGASYQFMEENYFRHRSNDDTETADTEVGTLAANLRLQTLSDFGTWDYGFEFAHDKVDATQVRYNPDGTVKTIYDQGLVADNADYYTYALFLQNTYKFNPNWEWINGFRYTWNRMEAGKVNMDGGSKDPVTGIPANANSITESLNGNWDAPAFSSRLLWYLNDELTLYGGVSTGFRAPNLSDSTRDDEFGGGEEAPTADLDSEKFVSYELGMRLEESSGWLNMTTYYTQMFDRIARLEKPDNTKANLEEGFVYGFEIAGEYYLTNTWSIFGDVAWQYGSEENYPERDLSSPTEDIPVSRIMPLTATTGLRYEPVSSKFWGELYVDMADQQDRYAEAEKTDNRFPPGGTPGYATFNVRGGYQLTKDTAVTVGVENIFDKSYRVHGSGVNEPGVNFIVSLRTNF